MRTALTTCILAVGMGVAPLAEGDVAVDDCRVAIELAATVFTVSHEVRPRVTSNGPDVLWLSGKLPRGFHVERQVGGTWQSSSERSEGAEPPAVQFRIREPDLLPIAWRAVASQSTPDGIVVAPGRYRLVLTFTLVEPGTTSSKTPPECTIRSAPFSVEKEESYTRWE